MPRKISLKQFLMRSGKFEKVYDTISAIKSGKITINKTTITNPNYFFNPKKSLVKIDNQKIKYIKKLYFVMNKPAGYLSQKSYQEKTIYNLLKKLNLDEEAVKSLFAVGRLDKDTEGLLIITNDGKLANIIMNPEHETIKKYYVILEDTVNINRIKQLEKGIEIMVDNEKYKTKPCKIRIFREKEVYISISEGKKRQIRKMFEAIGNNVVYLKRVSIGDLKLRNLKVGEFKEINRDEIMKSIQ